MIPLPDGLKTRSHFRLYHDKAEPSQIKKESYV